MRASEWRGELSFTPLLTILLAVTLTGLAWTWVATRIASGGNPIAALRND
ncbi:MAG: hypothetical protein ABGY29_07010 [bacterium]